MRYIRQSSSNTWFDTVGRKARGQSPAETVMRASLRPVGRRGYGGAARPLTLHRLVLDQVAEDADLLDLDLDRVAMFHPYGRLAGVADAGGRAHDKEIAGLERQAFGQQGDRLGDRDEHVAGIGALHDLTIETRLDGKARRARRQLVGGDEPGPEAAGLVEILADRPLRGLALVVAHAAVVEAGIARDTVERLVLGDMARRAADHGNEFGLVIELDRRLRPEHRLAMRDERGRAAHEEARIFRLGMTAFLGVIGVIEAEANDLARVPNRHQEAQPDKLVAGNKATPPHPRARRPGCRAHRPE